MVKREYPEQPIISVGGIIFSSESVLLIRRNQAPAKGEWSLPGGVVELGETLHAALMREIMEETSLRVKICGLVRVLDRILLDDDGMIRFHYVIADYWGWLSTGQPHAGSDANDARFWDLSCLGEAKVSNEVEDTILMAVKMKDKSVKDGFSE